MFDSLRHKLLERRVAALERKVSEMALSLANLLAQQSQTAADIQILAGLVSAENPGITQAQIDAATTVEAATDTVAQTAILAAGGTPATGPNPAPTPAPAPASPAPAAPWNW